MVLAGWLVRNFSTRQLRSTCRTFFTRVAWMCLCISTLPIIALLLNVAPSIIIFLSAFYGIEIAREKKNVVVLSEFLASERHIKNKAKRSAESDSWIDRILDVFARNDLKTFSIAEPENSCDNKLHPVEIYFGARAFRFAFVNTDYS